MYHSVELRGGGREGGGEGEMVKLPDKGRVWKRRWLSLSRRGDERWILLLAAFWWCVVFFFSFSPRCFASLRLPPSRLSVACTGGPQGSSSQPVSWSHPPEQHMTFHDYCYCLCPSSRCLQAKTQKKRWGSVAKMSKSGPHSLPVFPWVDKLQNPW